MVPKILQLYFFLSTGLVLIHFSKRIYIPHFSLFLHQVGIWGCQQGYLVFVNQTEDEMLLILILRQRRFARLCQGHFTFSCVFYHSQAFGSGLKVSIQLVTRWRAGIPALLAELHLSSGRRELDATFWYQGIKAIVLCVLYFCSAWEIFGWIFPLHQSHTSCLEPCRATGKGEPCPLPVTTAFF